MHRNVLSNHILTTTLSFFTHTHTHVYKYVCMSLMYINVYAIVVMDKVSSETDLQFTWLRCDFRLKWYRLVKARTLYSHIQNAWMARITVLSKSHFTHRLLVGKSLAVLQCTFCEGCQLMSSLVNIMIVARICIIHNRYKNAILIALQQKWSEDKGYMYVSHIYGELINFIIQINIAIQT